MKQGEAEKGPGWKEQRTARNLEAKKQAQAEMDGHHGRDLTQQLKGVAPAGEDELAAFREAISGALQDPAAKSWFKVRPPPPPPPLPPPR